MTFLFTISMILFCIYYPQNLDKARTIVLTTSIFSELFFSFSCRSDKENISKLGIFSNKFLFFSVLIAGIFQIIAIYTPLAGIFGFTALSALELIISIGASLTVLIVFELLKFFKKICCKGNAYHSHPNSPLY